MALMVQPFVLKYGADMAVLICFLKGCIVAILGIFHLGQYFKNRIKEVIDFDESTSGWCELFALSITSQLRDSLQGT